MTRRRPCAMLRFGDLHLELNADSTTSRVLIGDVDISHVVKSVQVIATVGDVTTANIETYVGSLRVTGAGLLVEGPPPRLRDRVRAWARARERRLHTKGTWAR